MKQIGLIVVMGAAFGSSPAFSGGYDTPILYSAEHMGMGGAGISYVDDPSAMFHNPAGLARTHGLQLMANVSLLTGSITSTPTVTSGNVESDPILSVAPLIGASYRVNELFAFGVAFYPVAAAGADYVYREGSGTEIINTTKITFLEITPNIAFKLPGNLRIGAGWRVSIASLDRGLKTREGGVTFDASLSGVNFLGFRTGIQWDPIPELQLGISYRHKTTTTIEADDGVVIIPDPQHVEADFVLPGQLGFGIRGNIGPFSILQDIQYTFQSDNDESIFKTDDILPDVNSVFEWQDSITLRTGLEYTLDKKFSFRAGYVFDGVVNQKQYASAFGTPPGPTHTMTLGFGYEHDKTWKANVAVAHRFGSATVEQSDVDGRQRACAACSEAGDYSIALTGIYVDFAYAFDL